MKFSDLIYGIHFIELTTAIIATINLKKFFFTKEKYFFYFLWFTFCVDFMGIFWKKLFDSENFQLFNIYTIISFTFYFFWMYTILKMDYQKKTVVLLSVLFLSVASYNCFILESNYYHSSTFVLGAIIYILLSLFFFSQLLNDKSIIDVKRNLKFWIATGLLLFNVGMGPFMMFSKYLKANNTLWVIILVSLNVILYTCYSLGFIWSKKKEN